MDETQQTSDPRPRFPAQRQDEMAALTRARGRVDVADLAEHFQVTTETIRRDLSDLQERRLLRRVHGGAVPWETLRFEPLLAVRGDQQLDEKRRIGAAAVDELRESGTVIIDSGSTTARFCEALPRDRPLHIVTNSILNAQVLAEFDNAEVTMIGGTLRQNTMAMVDAHAAAAIGQLTVDALFISCDGMSTSRGLTTPYEYEAALKRAMIAAARRVIVLADHSKLDNDQLFRFAEWSDIDVLVTDTGISEPLFEELSTLVRVVHRV
ncbi:DeoR/GlpR family DNA-binding transcription regulator [Ilumatobacter nonamiensis]|uniref:DeoR/GlpR family DNA-binding transcription regulator n=1 Tax=Ilumatobacter nonamiensis TaxID=467093 RepID=UPI00034B0815|nr:DeoR/GlpR family DNA-binding transcription regulator [Ilumatobacter nonamiensis]